MNLPRAFRHAWTTSKVDAAIVAVLGLVVLFLHTPLEQQSYDWPFQVRPSAQISELAMIYMDDISHGLLDQPYNSAWDRKLHARLLEVLTSYGVKAVAYDVVFQSEVDDPEGTAALAKAIRNHGHVVLGADFISSDHMGQVEITRPVLPAPSLLAATPHYGFTSFLDSDIMIREHFHGSPDAPSLSWALARILGAKVTQNPKEQQQKKWINYYGPRGTLPSMGFQAVLGKGISRTELAQFLTNRIVFVGSATQAAYSGKRQDQFKTSFSDGYWPGVEIHATEFLNLMHGDWLRRMPPVGEMGLLIAAGIGSTLLFGLLRPQTAVWVAAGIALLCAGVGMFQVWQTHVWFAWLITPCVQIPAALILAIAKKRPAVTLIPADLTTEFQPRLLESGMKLADHVMVRRIGQGSYGEVWLAKSATGASRAVKVLDQKSATDPRFEREFAGLKKFEPVSRSHEGLVDILHVGRNEAAGQFYYVMELADSCTQPADEDPERYVPLTLKARLQERDGISPSDFALISLKLTAALAYLHEQGLMHRDIKPSNIIFVEGHPKLADIGLVASADETRSFVGTEGYIPPEGPGTPASDVYSLGKVLTEVSAALSQAPDRNIQGLKLVVQRASAQNIKERYSNAMEMLLEMKKMQGLSV